MSVYDYSFSVDDFNDPTVHKDNEAVAVLITRLLLLEPGTFQSHPEMGVGLVSKYRYALESDANTLKSDLTNQIKTYLPAFQAATVEVEFRDQTFYISATIDQTVFGFLYTTSSDTVESQYTTLDQLSD